MTMLQGRIRGGRVEFDGPIDWPDGTVVQVTPGDDDGPMPPEEIARVLAAMNRSRAWNVTEEEAADADAWQKQMARHGMRREAEEFGDAPG